MSDYTIELILGLVTVLFTAGFFKSRSARKREKKQRDEEDEKRRLEIENLQLENNQLKNEKKETEQKLDFINRILDLEFINQIGESVNRMFAQTKADRFLILVARNGKVDFNIVSVVFEQHKKTEFRINAIARYRNVHIDNSYRIMLKDAERYGMVQIETAKMPDSVLKDFYEMEGITFSKVRFLARKPIDNDNDFLVYSSLSTHEKTDFTKREKAYIKTQYEGTIFPCINKMFD